ncbi:MAG: CPBP family intramembrane metalloprotease [Defluviitaleaceae bacterium]|nr:CPBP family intramembrane metalloprotease [Defluviitaleaceae bacterium]
MLTKRKKWLLLFIYVTGFLLIPPLAGGVVSQFLNLSGLGLLAVINLITYAILCGAVLLLSQDVFKKDVKKIDHWGKFVAQMAMGLIFTFGSVLVGNLIVMSLGTTEMATNQEVAANILDAMPFVMIITAIFLAPIVEEIIFRLVLMNLFDWKPVYQLLFSSLIFGLFHVLLGGWIHIISYTLAGLVFGYFYLKHRNIWHVTILHILHNGVTIGLMFWIAQLMS